MVITLASLKPVARPRSAEGLGNCGAIIPFFDRIINCEYQLTRGRARLGLVAPTYLTRANVLIYLPTVAVCRSNV
ncbi:hypothetical protein MARINON1_51382 [Marinobacter salarius]|nr:hypothetical protein MBHK15_130229 [Marinobacter salarius]VXB82300.1 hypothetical protein MARINON1_51382 [Marinobacter salarius]